MNKKTTLYLTIALAGVAVFVAGFLLQLYLLRYDPAVTLKGRIGAWVGAICAFAIFSYVYKENPVYRTFEHILLGLGLGFIIAITVRQVLIDKWYTPISDAVEAFRAGEAEPQSYWDICLVFAGCFGLLWYCQYSKKYLWLSRITIGVSAGAGAGLAVKRVSIETLPQITSTFKNVFVQSSMAPHLSVGSRWQLSIESFLFLLIVCCVLYYFFFSFRRDSALSQAPAKLGRFFLMISFGAFFGNTFMSRVVILIERVSFLLTKWLKVQ